MSSSRTGDPPARKGWPARVWDRIESTADAARRRSPWLDHLARAGGRYRRTQADLMAAGVTYFAFLGLFPVLMLIASIIGLVLSGNELLQEELYGAIRDTFPGVTGREIVTDLQAAVGSAQVVGIIGLVGFLYAGLRAMDKLRIGMDRIWKGHVEEPEFLRDNIQDVVALILLGGLGLLSLGLTGVATWATAWLLEMLGLQGAPGLFVLTAVVSLALAFAGDTVVFLWLLKVVPSTPHPLRRLLRGAMFGAAGFELLKLIGNLYLSLISGSVTASAFGGAVGILVWINIVFRFAFFTAAWTATLPGVADAAPAAEQPTAHASDGDRSPAR